MVVRHLLIPIANRNSYTWIVTQRFSTASSAVLFLCIASACLAQAPDVETIVQRSVAANNADWKANPEFDWTERDLQSDGGTKTFHELMILGSPYGRLVEINGKPVSADISRRQQQKLDAEIAKRRHESPQQRHKRISEFQKDRSRDRVMMEQLTKAFNFKLTGDEKIDSYDTYVLKATPKRGYQPPNMQAQALKGMQGTLWIDKTSFQWVKVTAEVVNPVSIEGFIAQVQPGTNFELEKAPVAEGVWLPKHYSMRAKAKVLYLFPHKGHDEETYWDYHRSQDYSVRGKGE